MVLRALLVSLGLVATFPLCAAIPALCPSDPFDPAVNPGLQTALTGAQAAHVSAQVALAGSDPALFVSALELFGEASLIYFLEVTGIAGSDAIAATGTASKQCCLKGSVDWESVVDQLVLIVGQYQGLAYGGENKFGSAGRSPLIRWYGFLLSPNGIQVAITDYFEILRCTE